MKRIMSNLNQYSKFIVFLISVLYSTDIFAEVVYWPFAVSVDLNEVWMEPNKVGLAAKAALMPVNIAHDYYENDIICNVDCQWVTVLKTNDGRVFLAKNSNGYTIGDGTQHGDVKWSNLSKSQMEAAANRAVGSFNVSPEVASKGCVALLPGTYGKDYGNVDSLYVPQGMSFDSLCIQPNPVNVSCAFDIGDVEFKFGQISINSSKKNEMTKKIKVSCTAEADLKFTSLSAGDNVLLSNGMFSSLTINNEKPGKKIHFKSGSQSISLTETLSGTASGFGDFEGYDILRIAYE